MVSESNSAQNPETRAALQATQRELAALQQQVQALEQQLARQQHEEYERLSLLSEGIRQELCFMIDIERALSVAQGQPLSEPQQQLLLRVSQTGQNILQLVQEYCEGPLM